MKAKDITEYEIGERCFGPILKVNGLEYDALSRASATEFIKDMCMNDINADSLRQELFRICLEHLQFNEVDSNNDQCDQCGNYNYYIKCVKED